MLTEFTFTQWWLLAWWAWTSWPWTRASGWHRRRACQNYCTWLEVSVWFLIPCWFSILEIIQISLLSLWQYLHLLPSLTYARHCVLVSGELVMNIMCDLLSASGWWMAQSWSPPLENVWKLFWRYTFSNSYWWLIHYQRTLCRFQNNTYIEDVSNLIMASFVFCADTCWVTLNRRAQWIHSQLDDDKCVYFKE